MSCPADIVLFDGTRGPGKTDSQLMRYRRNVGIGYGPFWRGIILDREYKNLDDLVAKSERWFPNFHDGAKFNRSKSDYKWTWPTGEQLLFRAVKKEADYWDYHGQEFPFIGWNELTKYPDPKLFESMMSCNRTSFRPQDFPQIHPETGETYYLPKLPLEVFATTNPYGAGHNWVKKRFVNAAPLGQLHRMTTRVFNPQTQQEEDVVKTQCRIFGSYRENKYLTPEYVAELHAIKDKNKKKAWLGGDWDITSGGMFDDIWDRTRHCVAPFPIPRTWRKDRSFDWGSSRPFSVGWWAESDGSDVRLPNGKLLRTVRGDLFRIGEWYGSTGNTNEGLKMLATEVTAGIIEYELKNGLYGFVRPGPADSAIYSTEDGSSIAANMAKSVKVNGSTYRGVRWMRADKRPGSRKAGWEACRERLSASLPNDDGSPREKPGIFVFDTCKDFLDYFPSLARDEKDMDDVDTDAEDHIGDEVRYKVMSCTNRARANRTTGT